MICSIITCVFFVERPGFLPPNQLDVFFRWKGFVPPDLLQAAYPRVLERFQKMGYTDKELQVPLLATGAKGFTLLAIVL